MIRQPSRGKVRANDGNVSPIKAIFDEERRELAADCARVFDNHLCQKAASPKIADDRQMMF